MPGQHTLHLQVLSLPSVEKYIKYDQYCQNTKNKCKLKKKKTMLHNQICNMLCRHLRVFDLKVFKWTWLWCKNIITQFCQTHRHRHTHRHAHRGPPCKHWDCATSQHSINRLIYTTGTTCFRRSLFTQICRRAQLETITLPQKSNVVGLAIPKCIF